MLPPYIEKLMKRIAATLLLVVLGFGYCSKAKAQGTVNFTNLGGGANAPVFTNDGLLDQEGGFSAHLVLSNGIDIGQPTGFLFSGIFAGGIRVVPGIPPGERVDFFIAVEHFGKYHGQSRDFSLVLGGGETPHLPPPTLTGMGSFSASSEPYLTGISDEYFFNPSIGCMWRSPSGDLLTLYLLPGLETDDEDGYEFCESFERVSPSLKIDYSLQIDGSLELTWPAGSVLKLFASSLLSGENSVLVTGASYSNGNHSVAISPSAPKMFYWLAEKTETEE
jgi:hypothetical protein